MAGFYGKLPEKGDFITRGLQRPAIDTLYEFFQLGIQASKSLIGEEWLSYYSVAPIWHFYLPPGLLNDKPAIGLWLPSVDSVNRNFPIVLADFVETPVKDVADFKAYSDWLVECENLLLDVIHEEVTFDEFCTQIVSKTAYQNITPNVNEGEAEVAKASSSFQEDDLSALINSPLQPTTDFEQALATKYGLLEFVVKKLCEQSSLNYDELKQEHISTLRQASEIFSEKNDAPTSFEFGCNMISAMNLLDDEPVLTQIPRSCIWYSEGNDEIKRQFVMTQGLPKEQEFYQFIQGF